jgi:Flp pilus assembly protein TadG
MGRKSMPQLPGFRARQGWARLLWSDSGDTMLEFAFVAPMLVLLLVMIIDLGMMLVTQSLLNGAAQDASRLIRTGQIYADGNSITPFENQICSDMAPVMSTTNCQSNVVFEVQTFSSFGSVSFTPCTQTSYQSGSGAVCSFSPGAATQIVGVRVTYGRSFMISWVGACLTTGGSCWFGPGTTGTVSGGNHTVPLMSTFVFQNEPFPSS